MNHRTTVSAMVLGLALLSSVAALAAPVRGASKNGTNSSQPNMNLFGPTQSAPKDNVGVAVQYICPNQDVADSNPGNFNDLDPNAPDTLKLAGSCAGGLYKFLVQVQPTKLKKNLTVTFNNLVGFTPATGETSGTEQPPPMAEQLCDTKRRGLNTLRAVHESGRGCSSGHKDHGECQTYQGQLRGQER